MWGRRIAVGGAMTGFRPHLDYARPVGLSKRGERSVVSQFEL
jgi:hypothetical protein